MPWEEYAGLHIENWREGGRKIKKTIIFSDINLGHFMIFAGGGGVGGGRL